MPSTRIKPSTNSRRFEYFSCNCLVCFARVRLIFTSYSTRSKFASSKFLCSQFLRWIFCTSCPNFLFRIIFTVGCQFLTTDWWINRMNMYITRKSPWDQTILPPGTVLANRITKNSWSYLFLLRISNRVSTKRLQVLLENMPCNVREHMWFMHDGTFTCAII